MDRRAFFTRGASKVVEKVSQHAVIKARKNAEKWIRPPFAIEELDFLLACNRCGDCTAACPEGVIFPLSANLGVQVFNTPAMDLQSRGCHLCEGWPCVSACEKSALKLPDIVSDEMSEQNANEEEITAAEDEQRILPDIARVSINVNTCLPYSGPECGACKVCPVEGAMIWEMEKPRINEEICTGCALCREACIVEPKAIHIQSKYKVV